MHKSQFGCICDIRYFQEKEGVFLLDDSRISEIHLASGRSRKKNPKLQPLLQKVLTMSASQNGKRDVWWVSSAAAAAAVVSAGFNRVVCRRVAGGGSALWRSLPVEQRQGFVEDGLRCSWAAAAAFFHQRSVFLFTFMHLSDAFIQSHLQYSCYTCVFPGNRTHNLCAANAMLYHWATGTLFLSSCMVIMAFMGIKFKIGTFGSSEIVSSSGFGDMSQQCKWMGAVRMRVW